MHVKKNDTVMIITGKDAGKSGKVLKAMPEDNRIVVEGVNMQTRHKKPRNQQEQGGRVQQEGAIDASNAMLFCEKCKKPVRVRSKVLENGEKIRVCAKCGATL